MPCSVPRVLEPALVTVTRNGLAESTHRVHVAVTRADGSLVAGCGDVGRPTTMRSCAKPHQVQPLLASGGFDALGLDERILAVTCASHMGQDIHVEAVERGLRACGLTADALDNCIGTREDKLRHNCSGNHLGFLANSVHHGWETAGYRHPGHPSQDAALAEVAARAGVAVESIRTCTDGCGVVAFELPLSTIAAMYARIPEELPRQFAAMRAHPELVRGDGDLDTELMRALPGVVAKGGAEALAAVGLEGERLGVAVRVEDGGYRAIDPVLVETLRQVLGWESVPDALQPFAEPVVPNFVGDRVVRLTARVELSTRAG
jgi:L-asparaginase II